MDEPGSAQKKPRLLFVSNLFPDLREPYRGLDNVTILHHLKDQFDIRVVAPRPTLPFLQRRIHFESRHDDRQFRPEFFSCPYLPKIGGLANHHLMLRALRPVILKIHEEWPTDVLLSSWLFPDGFAAASIADQLGIPSFLVAQGSDVHQYLQSAPRRKAILEACQKARGIITRSASLAMMLNKAGVPKEKLHPIHNGTDTQLFQPANQADVRRQLNLAENSTVLLFVGNLLPVKDPLFLIQCFAALIQQFPQKKLRLVLVGKGPLRSAIENEATRLGIKDRIHLAGPLDSSQVARWMQASDLLVMTSRNEGLPNVILEAQAVGLPIVATNVGDIAEMLPSHELGTATHPQDAEDWIQATAQYIQNPADKALIAKTGQKRTWEATTARYADLLKTVLPQGHRCST